jgi:hypothetical protein
MELKLRGCLAPPLASAAPTAAIVETDAATPSGERAGGVNLRLRVWRRSSCFAPAADGREGVRGSDPGSRGLPPAKAGSTACRPVRPIRPGRWASPGCPRAGVGSRCAEIDDKSPFSSPDHSTATGRPAGLGKGPQVGPESYLGGRANAGQPKTCAGLFAQ